jgi:hypothetical protein
MGRFDDITLEELLELREQTEGEIPRERVLVAIGRKQGDQIDTLAERHGVERSWCVSGSCWLLLHAGSLVLPAKLPELNPLEGVGIG